MAASRPKTGGSWLVPLAALWLAVVVPSAPAQQQLLESPVGRKISDVIPDGNKIRSTQHILAKMGTLAKGGVYDEKKANDAVAALLATGWFQPNGVHLDTTFTPDGQVAVWVRVRELPNTVREINFVGNQHYSERSLLEAIRVRKGAPLNPAGNRAAANAITQKMREDGRYFATCTLVKGADPADDQVTFHIVEGPVVRVGGVEFRGNSGKLETSDGRLKTVVKSRGPLLGTPTVLTSNFTPQLLDVDRRALLQHYHRLGYLDALVDVEVEPTALDLSAAKVIFHIREGQPYTVRNVRVEGNKVYPENKLLPLTEQKGGKVYDELLVQRGAATMTRYYGSGGHQVRVLSEPFAVPDQPGVVDVCYRVLEPSALDPDGVRGQAPRRPDRVGEIRVSGNTYTQKRVILNELRGIEPGQILDYSRLKDAEQALARRNLWDQEDPPTVEVDPNSPPDSEYKDIIVRVKEAQTGQVGLQVGVNSNAGVNGTFMLNQRNFDILRFPTSFDDLLGGRAFRGAGQELSLRAMPGQVFQQYEATWREPYFRDSRFGLSLSGYYTSSAFNEFTLNRYGGRGTLDYRFDNSPIWLSSFTTRVEGVDVTRVPVGAPPAITDDLGKHFLLGLRTGLTRDTRDSFLMPSTGSLLDVGYEQLLGDYTVPIGTAEFTKFWTLHQARDGGWKGILAHRTSLTVMGGDAPVFERVFGGGFRSLRGFAFRGVGPVQNGYYVGGDFAFLNTVEYQLPLVANDRISFVAFCDHGTVNRGVSLDDYRVSVGVGLRLRVPALGPLPIALDFGFPVRRAPQDQKQIFSFYLGWIGGQ
jgi:outer membrane protein insertion porin family